MRLVGALSLSLSRISWGVSLCCILSEHPTYYFESICHTQTEPDFELDIKDDVQDECSKFGTVKHIFVEK